MSFGRHEEIFSEENKSKGRKRPESSFQPSVGTSFQLAIPWPVALQQSRPPLRQLWASVNDSCLGVEKFSVNGTLSLNCLSHLRGQVQEIPWSSSISPKSRTPSKSEIQTTKGPAPTSKRNAGPLRIPYLRLLLAFARSVEGL